MIDSHQASGGEIIETSHDIIETCDNNVRSACFMLLCLSTLRCRAEIVPTAGQLLLGDFSPRHGLAIAVDQLRKSVLTTAVTESTLGEVERSSRGLVRVRLTMNHIQMYLQS